MTTATIPAQITETAKVKLRTNSITGEDYLQVTVGNTQSHHSLFDCIVKGPENMDFFERALVRHYANRSIVWTNHRIENGYTLYDVTYQARPIVIGGRVFEDI